MRLRFAPSPTGPLHLGGLRTALYNHILARAAPAATWLLRIEDTDAARTVPTALPDIQRNLTWAGLIPDNGPIFQSTRLEKYNHYAKSLLDTHHAYRCFCSPDRLASTREKLAKAGSSASYDRHCAHLTSEDISRRLALGHKHVVRFDVARTPKRAAAHDLVFGAVRDAHASLATDPIILKSDGFPTYHLASVVDDWDMGITHVLRGEEWLASLPLHLDLYASLQLRPPQFAHLPILLNADGSKMSKRFGDVRVAEFRERGWEPEALVNWLILAGWGTNHGRVEGSPDSTEIMSMQEIIERFSLDALTHRNSILDALKLAYINKHHLMCRIASPDALRALAERVEPRLEAEIGAEREAESKDIQFIEEAIKLVQGRLTNLYDLPEIARYLFAPPSYTTPEAKAVIASISPSDIHRILSSLRGTLDTIPASYWATTHFGDVLKKEREGLDFKMQVYMKVVRWALAGVKDGPAAGDLVRVLGRERVLKRLDGALKSQE